MVTPQDIERREKEKETERELERIAATHVCAECGGQLVTPWDPSQNRTVLRCGMSKAHTGYVLEDPVLTRYFSMRCLMVATGQSTEAIDAEIQSYLNKKHSRKGKHMTTGGTALQHYQERGLITEQQAMDIIRTTPGWGKAPDNVIKKAALICRDYKLYPGIHVFLLKFQMKDGTESWSPAFGIKTNRLLASRRKAYKYVDGPRVASEEEARKHFLDEYNPELIYAYCKLEGLDGSQAEGWGTWPKKDEVYGRDKGNSKANMAEIRCERRALDRLCPGELPTGFDVVDEQYVAPDQEATPEPGQVRTVDKATGEIVEGEKVSKPPTDPPSPHGWCPIHHVQLVKGKYGVYCPKKVKNSQGVMVFCKGVQKEAPAASQQPSLLSQEKTPTDPQSAQEGGTPHA